MKRTQQVASLLLLALFVGRIAADSYLHNPRGSNNRLNEQNQNRDTNGRLFDSQNNARGGYNVGDNFANAGDAPSGGGTLKYYAGSKLWVEWTNQHGCGVGHPKVRCEIILQYMCDDTATNNNIWNSGQTTPMRDGTTTTEVTATNANDNSVGRHEPVDWSKQCTARQRNLGLFTADQNLNGQTALFTRQNPNGNQDGLECPEERDYYPYWHPSPWKDIAVLTWNTSLCPYYQAESNNVKAKGYCTVPTQNNPGNCSGAGGTWQTYSHNLPAPDCLPAPFSRDNHNGNSDKGWQPDSAIPEASLYQWTVPDVGGTQNCVLRLRYNISTGDYWGHDGGGTFVDASFNGPKLSPVLDNPTIDIGIRKGLAIALNTDQTGRTFQDRSHLMTIMPNPGGGTIYNLNVRGRRGNIVDVYPAVEYDFVPNNLTINSGDRVHIQWTGSTTSPDGQDKNNMVQIAAPDVNYPLPFSAVTMFTNTNDMVRFATAGATSTFQSKLQDRPAYYDGGLMSFPHGIYYYMCTVNNDFSNRSQKGVITVN